MKKLLFAFVVTAAMIGCSTENSESQETSAQLLQRGGKFDDFDHLLDEIYVDYVIDETVTYEDEEHEMWDVTKVRNDAEGFVGYFVQKQGSSDVVFLDYNHTLGSVDEYVIKNSNYDKTTFDLTQDPNYAIIGFDPANNVVGEKFWGSTTTNCHNEYVGNSCYIRKCTYTKWRFWIRSITPNVPVGGVVCN